MQILVFRGKTKEGKLYAELIESSENKIEIVQKLNEKFKIYPGFSILVSEQGKPNDYLLGKIPSKGCFVITQDELEENPNKYKIYVLKFLNEKQAQKDKKLLSIKAHKMQVEQIEDIYKLELKKDYTQKSEA